MPPEPGVSNNNNQKKKYKIKVTGKNKELNVSQCASPSVSPSADGWCRKRQKKKKWMGVCVEFPVIWRADDCLWTCILVYKSRQYIPLNTHTQNVFGSVNFDFFFCSDWNSLSRVEQSRQRHPIMWRVWKEVKESARSLTSHLANGFPCPFPWHTKNGEPTFFMVFHFPVANRVPPYTRKRIFSLWYTYP